MGASCNRANSVYNDIADRHFPCNEWYVSHHSSNHILTAPYASEPTNASLKPYNGLRWSNVPKDFGPHKPVPNLSKGPPTTVGRGEVKGHIRLYDGGIGRRDR